MAAVTVPMLACIGAGLAIGVVAELLARRYGWMPAAAVTAAVFVLLVSLVAFSSAPPALVVVSVLALTSAQYVARPLLKGRAPRLRRGGNRSLT